MWYHGILPTLGIMVTALTAPVVINYYLCKLVQKGNAYRRDVSHPTDLHLYWRDIRLTGNPYVMQGLDGIPDSNEGRESGGGFGTDGHQHQTKTPMSTDSAWHTTPCPPEAK